MDDPEVPPYFICPISLQVMKDPVTISTGVSYDRDSIDCWLSDYHHNTCPVTNQPLADQSLTPNSILLRLITSWATAHATTSSRLTTTTTTTFNISDLLRDLVESSTNPHLQLTSLKMISSFLQDGAENDITLTEKAGATEIIASLITALDPLEGSELIDEATSILHVLKPSPESLKQASESENGELIISLSMILQRGSRRSRTHAALLLRSIFKVVDNRYKTGLRLELFDGVLEMLKDQNLNRSASMAALSILIEVVAYGPNQVIEAGAVPVMVELLIEKGEDPRMCEAMLWVLEVVCRRSGGRAALLEHSAGVAAVVGSMLRVSSAATNRAVKVLLLLCRFCVGGRMKEEMMEVGGVAKICMVVQVECCRKARERAKEILGMNIKGWSKSPCFSSYCLP